MFGSDSEEGTDSAASPLEEKLRTGPVPRVSMDYFYLSDLKSRKGEWGAWIVNQRVAEAIQISGEVRSGQ